MKGKQVKTKDVNMERGIQYTYNMAAGKNYEGKDKLECLH